MDRCLAAESQHKCWEMVVCMWCHQKIFSRSIESTDDLTFTASVCQHMAVTWETCILRWGTVQYVGAHPTFRILSTAWAPSAERRNKQFDWEVGWRLEECCCFAVKKGELSRLQSQASYTVGNVRELRWSSHPYCSSFVWIVLVHDSRSNSEFDCKGFSPVLGSLVKTVCRAVLQGHCIVTAIVVPMMHSVWKCLLSGTYALLTVLIQNSLPASQQPFILCQVMNSKPEEKTKADDYDKTVRELAFEIRGKVSEIQVPRAISR